jgi:dephospho-CoA kinase
MIIGITGLFGSGKDTAAEYLKKKGFEHHSLSDEIRIELKKRGIEATRENMQRAGTELREKFGRHEIARRALGRCKSGKCVLTSIRSPGAVKFLKKQADFVLWEIWCPLQKRYRRVMKRASLTEKNTTSFKEFRKQEEKELRGKGARQNLLGVIELANEKIKNDKDIKTLERRIDEALKKV